MVNNRPFGICNASFSNGLADIFNNLHGRVGKTALLRILAQLADKQQIMAKSYGKQTVYVINQVCHM